MKKNFKLIIISLFLLSILMIKANAETGTGICYGKEIETNPAINKGDTDYCALGDPVIIDYQPFYSSGTEFVKFNNGASAAYNNYFTNYFGTSQHLFCIDKDKASPDGLTHVGKEFSSVYYWIGRSINMDKYAYDKVVSKIYQQYIHGAVYLVNNSSYTIDEALAHYLQDLNITLRAVTVKFGYGNPNEPYFIEAVKQLEGLDSSYSLVNKSSSDHVSIIKKWYCSGFLALADTASTSFPYGRGLSSLKSYCKGVKDASAWTPGSFELKMTSSSLEGSTEESKIQYNADGTFKKIVPVKVSGLSQFFTNYDSFKVTNPYVHINSVSCNNDKLSCSIENSEINSSKNILDYVASNQGNEYTFNVVVTGKSADFKTSSTAKITINYATYHILDPRNLGILKYTYGDDTYQRMVIVMPSTPQKADLEVSLKLPSVCAKTTVKDANGEEVNKYTYEGKDVTSMTDFINEGCCSEIDPSDLSTEDEVKAYTKRCPNDVVKLVQACGDSKNSAFCENKKSTDNVVGSYTTSIISNPPLDTLLENVNQIASKKTTITSLVDDTSYQSTIANKTDNSYISSTNNYCKLFTSETNVIKYPTTTIATSGRYFVFAQDESGNFTQPNVAGTIDLDLHVYYEQWLNDYKAAIEAEKVAYTDWQTELAKQSANDNALKPTKPDKCPACKKGEDSKKCGGSYTTYSGFAPDKTYFNADGTPISESVTYTTGDCNVSGNPLTINSTIVSGSVYQAAVRAREALEKQMDECSTKAKNMQSDWKYNLNPKLTFEYEQTTDTSKSIKTSVDLEVSKSAVKYWPGVTKDPVNSTVSGTFSTSSAKDSYGGGTSAISISYNYLNHNDFTMNSAYTIFYRPSEKYYSLVPTGLTVTSDKKIEGKSIEMGYVFNIEITNYQGQYTTWFDITNVGHQYSSDPSNIQNSLTKYLKANTKYTEHSNVDTTYSNKCIYCDVEVLYERSCATCEDGFKPQYVYRTISLDNINPNNRTLGANWSDDNAKAKATKDAIKKASDSTYDDYTKNYLEYEFNFSTQDMQAIKAANAKTTYDDWDLNCNSDGLECQSDFVTEWSKDSDTSSITDSTRSTKWKYYDKSTNSIVNSYNSKVSYEDQCTLDEKTKTYICP